MPPATITDTQGIIAIAAAAVAVAALLGCIALSISVRRLRGAQRMVLGEHDRQDVVAHAASMQEAFEALREYLDEAAARLDGRLAGAAGSSSRPRRPRRCAWLSPQDRVPPEMSKAPEPPAGRARVGYLGPQGTFSEEALLDSAAADALEPVALASIYDTVSALRRGEVRFAIVPIENSLEGSINVTLDLLAGEASDVRIVGEALLRVHHCLIAAQPLA